MADADVIDAAAFRRVLGHYPTGVSVITSADDDDRPAAGMVVGTFTSVSLDPPLVAFLPDKGSSSWPLIAATARFCVNVLSAEQEDLCRAFAARGGDKFAGVDWHPSPSGTPILDGVVAWVDCQIEQVVESGDHYIVVGRVLDMAVACDAQPLAFHRGGFSQLSPVADTVVDPDDMSITQLAARIFPAERSADFGEEVAALARRYVDGYAHLSESRSDLIVTMLIDYLRHLVSSYRGAAADAADAAGCLRSFVSATLQAHMEHRAAAVLYQNERQSLVDTDTTELERLEHEMQTEWRRVIDWGSREGIFRRDADSAVTYFLIRDALFLIARWFRTGGRLPLQEVGQQYEELFLHGLLATDPDE
jgi:flavin reductase (DIM6/NTAB) family NADH-FMN oxidoreductase RutF